MWSLALQKVLKKAKLCSTRTDPQLYFRHEGGKLCLLLSVHVDDLKLTGTDACIKEILACLEKEFDSLKLEFDNFTHLGLMHQLHSDGSRSVNQTHYIRELKPIAEAELRLRPKTEQVEDALQKLYMSLVGGLAWVVQTRPDVAVFIAALQRKLKQPTVQDLLDANRVLKYLKLKPLSLTYRKLQHPWRLVAISDSAFKSDGTDCLAMRSGVIAVCNKDGVVKGTNDLQVLEFVSKKQSKVCRSTFAAELHSGLDLVGLAMVINAALCEVLQGPQTAASLVAMQDAGSMPLELD